MDNLYVTQKKLSESVGWAESTGRSWIKFFKEIIPYHYSNGAKVYDQQSLKVLTYIKKISDLGLSKNDIKLIFSNYGVPSNEKELQQIINAHFGSESNKLDVLQDIPSQKGIAIPFLKVINNGKVYSAIQILDLLTSYFSLSDKQRSKSYEKSKDSIFVTRVRGARYSLIKQGYVEEVSRNNYSITKEGLELLNDSEEDIIEEVEELESVVDPITVVEDKLTEIKNDLAQDIIIKLQNAHWRRLEYIVVELLTEMGYGDGKVTEKTNDEGFDGIIKEDKLGLDNIYVQAKKWDKPVGRPEVMGFSGALDAKSAKKGIFITTSHFTKGAIEYVSRLEMKKIILIDGTKLANLMMDHNIGVNIKKQYVVKEIDYDYFESEE